MQRVIQHRKKIEINTDPLRRCYDGCHAESEFVWTAWEILEYIPKDWSIEKIGRRLEFWNELNNDAVKARGESARSQYRFKILP